MDGYSRLIAWLKVLLPLMALGLLSTLFLLSQNNEPIAQIPFAETEIRDRLASQQVTGPFFSGVTPAGDRMSISAARLLTYDGQVGENEIEDVSAQFDLVGGTRVILFSDAGTVSMAKSTASLSGNVVFTSSTGYKLTSALLEADMSQLYVRSPGPVQGNGPFGTLHAGTMTLFEPEGQESPYLLFTEGVKLVYQPGGTVE